MFRSDQTQDHREVQGQINWEIQQETELMSSLKMAGKRYDNAAIRVARRRKKRQGF